MENAEIYRQDLMNGKRGKEVTTNVEREMPSAEELLKEAGIRKSFSSKEVAQDFFGEKVEWLYFHLYADHFHDQSGNLVEAKRVGKGNRRRFSLDNIRNMAASTYDRGYISYDQLLSVLEKVKREELDAEPRTIT